jgi:hypothetical protein
MGYTEFIEAKSQLDSGAGFEPVWMPDFLFDFQAHLVEWAIRQGRAAIFADCGLGKTPMQLVWAENIHRKTRGNVLVLTPLAVGAQTVKEAEKFGIEARQSRDGTAHKGITVTNYERLHYFDSSDFVAVVCDESGILKNFDSVRRGEVTEFTKKTQYRLLCTATAAPNDYIELGNSSEVLGYMGFSDMISKFFKKNETTASRKDEYRAGVYRFRGHSERDFWRWVCSWARALRKPSDFGFDDRTMKLPPLNTIEHKVRARRPAEGMLFDLPSVGLQEQREELRRTLPERCEMAAELANSHDRQVIAWCHLNDESAMLKRLIDGAVEIKGSDTDERKEKVFSDFADGKIRALVTKPKIAGFGMNFQNCSDQIYFPSHSYEQYYQAIRRSWRFGQDRPVNVDLIYTDGQEYVLKNLNRKANAADKMFEQLVSLMRDELRIERDTTYTKKVEVASWL